MRFAFSVALTMLLVCTQTKADQVMAVVGNAVLVRGQQQYQVVNRAFLQTGDTIVTSQNGGISFALKDAFVYAGPNAQLTLDAGKTLQVAQGQVRVLTRQNSRMTVMTPSGNLVLNGGIQHIEVSNRGSRFAGVTGNAEIQWRSNPNQAGWAPNRSVAQVSHNDGIQFLALQPNAEIQVANGQASSVNAQVAGSWNINVAMLQQQAVNNSRQQLYTVQDPARQRPDTGQNPNNVPPIVNGQNGQVVDDPFRRRNDEPNADQRGAQEDEATRRRPPDSNSSQFGSSSLASIYGGFSANAGTSASGGLFADANQSTNQGQIVDPPPAGYTAGNPFPGNIHLVTSDRLHPLKGLEATGAQLNDIVKVGESKYFSIGVGSMPTGQISTDFATASDADPGAIKIPGMDNFVFQLSQYGITDPIIQPEAQQNTIGITGLVGNTPSAPSVTGATPLLDTRDYKTSGDVINEGATFALGEFRLSREAKTGILSLSVRRSDQDRRIVKDPGGDDSKDIVTPNTAVEFKEAVDPRFLPAAPTVQIPTTYDKGGIATRFNQLNDLRRAAATVVLADQLFDIAKSTGQTRFAIDGKVIDISGYRK